MTRTAFALALLFALPATAQTTTNTGSGTTTIPPTANTGAVDDPKTTTSGNEKVTTDAAGVPKGTVGSGAPSSDLNATAATKRKSHHRAKPKTPEG